MASRALRFRGLTMLESILALGIAAGAILLASRFALTGLSITNDLHTQQDFDAANRRVGREFAADIAQATRFHFGYSNPATGQLRTIVNPDAQELTVGYVDRRGNDIWIHYGSKAAAGTGKVYLLKTSNQADPATYATQVLASDLEGLTFRFYGADGQPTGLISLIKRVEMDLTLADASAKRTSTFIGTLRGQN
ncbi:MAG TPA: hypothetical protein VEI97_08890, partial [bacterium]|nr:hypothetical protein [bacterium]